MEMALPGFCGSHLPHKLGHLSLDLGTSVTCHPGSWSFGLKPVHLRPFYDVSFLLLHAFHRGLCWSLRWLGTGYVLMGSLCVLSQGQGRHHVVVGARLAHV